MVIGIDCSRAFANDKTGTENYSHQVVKELLRLPAANSHIFVLFIRPNIVLPSWVEQYSNVRAVEIKYRYLWTQVGLARASWREHLDVLWVPAHTLPVLRNPRIRTVVTIHGLEYQWLPEYQNILQRWYLPLSTRYAARMADQLIAVSKFTKKQLVKQFHTQSKKIKVIYEGVDGGIKDGRQADIKDGVQNKKYMLFVGTLMPRKNLPALIEAFSLLGSEFEKYRLVIAGAKGWMSEEIYQAVRQYDVQDRVVFAGRVSEEELARLYQEASLYIQPSLTEGFGLPVLEAMSWGVPVIASDGGALSEVVGEAGIVVKLGKGFCERLASEMERVLESCEIQQAMRANGYLRAKMLSWTKAASVTLKVLATS